MDIFNKYKKQIIYFLILGVSGILVFYRFDIKYLFLEIYRKKLNNKEQDNKLKKLHPIFRIKVANFLKELEDKNIPFIITSTFRSVEDQQILFSQGKTTAKPLFSKHNFGFAIDLNIDGAKMNSSKNKWLPFVEIANKYNLKWGGSFNKYDPVHFYAGEDTKILRNSYLNNKLTLKKFVKL